MLFSLYRHVYSQVSNNGRIEALLSHFVFAFSFQSESENETLSQVALPVSAA